jgi:dTDP-4-amino-4,6-dideoxygalactose transaminase
MINVTKVHLPPLDEYVALLRGIWDRGHITNNGPLVVELERRLREQLGVPYLFLVANGTLAIHIAIKALRMTGSVITTPFSYVATTAAPVWENLKPLYADIDQRLCLDPAKLPGIWRDDVSGIIATHVYGNACDVDGIAAFAKARSIPVIYDAAHAFGAKLRGRSLASFGDIATLSFHATKLFHSGEGGALIVHDPELAKRVEYLRNFGHASPESFHDFGTNAKVSELHAALGLCVLDRVPELIKARLALVALYDRELQGLPLTRPIRDAQLENNGAYYPILFADEETLHKVRSVLNTENIFPRRYFYPSLSTLHYVDGGATPYADSISTRVLCLPLWAELEPMQVTRICALIRRALI